MKGNIMSDEEVRPEDVPEGAITPEKLGQETEPNDDIEPDVNPEESDE